MAQLHVLWPWPSTPSSLKHDDDDDDDGEKWKRSGVSDLVGFDDALALVVPPFLLQLLQLFALEQLKDGNVDFAPVHDRANSTPANASAAVCIWNWQAMAPNSAGLWHRPRAHDVKDTRRANAQIRILPLTFWPQGQCMPRSCHGLYMSTYFGADSSNRFPFRARINRTLRVVIDRCSAYWTHWDDCFCYISHSRRPSTSHIEKILASGVRFAGHNIRSIVVRF